MQVLQCVRLFITLRQVKLGFGQHQHVQIARRSIKVVHRGDQIDGRLVSESDLAWPIST